MISCLGYINQNVEYKCEPNEFWNTHKPSEGDSSCEWLKHVCKIASGNLTSGITACL